MNGWDVNLESDFVLTNGIEACIEALETGQVQAAADLLSILRTHVRANNEAVKISRASAPYIYALAKIRRRANDEGTKNNRSEEFINGLRCAANMLEKQYRKCQ